ncbi:MAG TPA: class II aldolase/adducin family protein [Spirochaetota bacterium]|nr:class II aldolase/adducin family protein [Spirochaetota bacterium]HNT09402.1 class II aldolase/adducin family protein [Spirochaetota bacterium]
MERLIRKYEDKLVAHGLCDPGAPLIGARDDAIRWNRDDARIPAMEEIFAGMNIASLLFARPAEPFFSIMERVAHSPEARAGCIRPQDSETRTFLHDIPVLDAFVPRDIIATLKRRKSAIVRSHGIVTYGTVSPEQAFVFFSSVCFSIYVKFFADYRDAVRAGTADAADRAVVERALASYESFVARIPESPRLMRGPFTEPDDCLAAIVEAGRMTVECRMVDSFFGNISYRLGDTVYISQTGSSLDELAGMIDPCPMDNSSCAAITASSELSAHRGIYRDPGVAAILHGHPKFAVIASLDCDDDACAHRGRCHVECARERFVGDVPIVPGEVGTGPHGLCNTLPPAMRGRRGAIVFGHGLFTTDAADFTDAFASLIDIERMCLEEYRRTITG